MFEIGDKLVHSPEGVCVVEDIVEMDVEKEKKEKKEYYMLRSITDHSVVVYVSTQSSRNSLRKLKSKEEIKTLLNVNPEEEIFLNQNNQKKINIQKQVILKDDSEKLMGLIKLYSRKKEQSGLSIGDNLWLEHAKKYLMTEISEVLG